MAKFKLINREKESTEVKKKWIENAIMTLLSSVVITVLLGLIPRSDYAPQTMGRGLPFAWYVKFQMDGAVPQIYWDRFFVDLLIVFLLAGLFLVEAGFFKKIRMSAKKVRAERMAAEARDKAERSRAKMLAEQERFHRETVARIVEQGRSASGKGEVESFDLKELEQILGESAGEK